MRFINLFIFEILVGGSQIWEWDSLIVLNDDDDDDQNYYNK